MEVTTATVSDDEAECRICRGGEEPQRPLFHPCKCSGSIKYTHEDCLVNWLAQSGTARCELCNFSFRFEPLYQPNTPRALPTDELVIGLLVRARAFVSTFARVALVLFVWLFVLPLGTCWTWYALFISSLGRLPSLIGSRGFSGVVTDAFYGCLLSAGIVFVFLGVSSLREYIRHLPEDGADANVFLDDLADIDHLDLHNPDDIPDEDEQLRLVDLGADEGGDVFVHDSGDSDDPDAVVSGFDSQNDEADALANESSDDGTAIREGDDGQDLHAGDDDDALYDDEMPHLTYSDDEDLSDEDVADLHANVPPDDAHRHDEEQGGLNDADEEDGAALFGLFELDPEEVPLEEMVGLRGNIRQLFDNAGTVLVSNAIFLGIFILIPLLAGRLALRVLSLRTISVDAESAPAVSSAVQTSLNATADAVSAANETSSDVVAATVSEALGLHALNVSIDDAVTTAGNVGPKEPLVSYSDNLVIVLLGYGVISILAVVYVVANSLLRSRYPRLDTPMTRQVARVLRYLATFVKIVVLILFEFGIFPLGCGWWLDLCTLRLLDSSIDARTAFCREFPWTCTAGHWFLGIFYMVHVSMFVSHLREILRPQLLWFLRNPDDPDFRPFRELVEKPLSRHARRMCLSTLIYGPLILALVFVPSELCLALLPNVFPLNFSNFSSTLVEVPFANVLALPLVSLVHHAQAGKFARIALKLWTEHVGYALGIDDVVLRADAQLDRNNHLAGGNDEDNDILDDADVFAPFDDEDVGQVFPVDANGVDGREESATFLEAEQVLDDRPGGAGVWVRGLFMLFLAWVTLVASACVAITAPTVVGRYVMKLVGLSDPHDLHAVGLGIYLILGFAELACRLHNLLASVDTQTAIQLAVPYIATSFKSVSLAFLWFGCVSLGTGVLAELVVTIPFRVAHNESPFFYLHQDWALGFLLVKVWTRIVLAGGFNTDWRDRLGRAREGGFFGVGEHFVRTWREVVYPVVWGEALALAAPYALTQGLLPALGASRLVSSTTHRYIYLFLLCMYFGHTALGKCKSGLYALHDSIRDDKYLVGKKLYNWEARSGAAVRRLSNGT